MKIYTLGIIILFFIVGCTQNTSTVEILMESENEVRMSGKISPGGENTCPTDGVCSIKIDNYEIIWATGWDNSSSRGEFENNLSIGDKVEVYGKKLNNNRITIYGSESYYIKKINH